MFRTTMELFLASILLLAAELGWGAESAAGRQSPAGRELSRGLAEIIYEPSHVRTEKIAEWESLQYGMFIHFGMNTFVQQEIALGDAPPTAYAPTELDVDQWVRVAKDAGMKYAVLTAKHTSGFCLWDSKVQWQGKEYDYDVGSSGNKTDVVAEFMKACRKYGIKPGFYYCIMDHHNSFKEVVWDSRKAVTTEYFELVRGHLTELLRNYPGIYEIWLDIPLHLSQPERNVLYALVKGISRDCFVLFNGHAGRQGVEVPDQAWPADLLNSERETSRGARPYDPWHTKNGRKYYLPEETCDTMTPSWFWFPNEAPRPVQDLHQLYSTCRRKGINLLLNVGPDKRGKIPQDRADRLMELKRAIDNPALVGPRKPLIAFDQGGYGKWISKDATYEASSADPKWSANEKKLLSGEDYDGGYACHTKEEDNPFIIIDLKRSALVKGIEIVNRTDMVPERARTLTVWLSQDKKDWKEVWRAADVEEVWTIGVTHSPDNLQKPGAQARYIKIGLREKNYLHLYGVRVYGEKE